MTMWSRCSSSAGCVCAAVAPSFQSSLLRLRRPIRRPLCAMFLQQRNGRVFFHDRPEQQQQKQQHCHYYTLPSLAARNVARTRLFASSSRSAAASCSLMTNPKSATVKKIQALLSSKNKRHDSNQVVVEGLRMVHDLYHASAWHRSLIQQIVVDVDKYEQYAPMFLKDYDDSNQHSDDYGDGEDDDHQYSPQWMLASSQVLQACTDTVHNQGIVAICTLPDWTSRHRDNDSMSKQDSSETDEEDPATVRSSLSFALILDGVSDPGNVGTLIRSAVACGVHAIYVLPDCCDVWNPKALRSAMGATFFVPTYSISSLDEWIKEQETTASGKATMTRVYAATMLEADDSNDMMNGSGTVDKLSTRKSIPHYDVDWCGGGGGGDPDSDSVNGDPSPYLALAPSLSTALIIGSEGHGLSAPIRQAVRDGTVQAVHVPMQASPLVESLNAAVCGSVILFEYQRQRALKART